MHLIRSYQQSDRDFLTKIFYSASKVQHFASAEEKQNFEYRYLGIYLENYQHNVLVVEDNKRVLGYVCGAESTDKSEFLELHSYLHKFTPYFSDYPAHLHINMDESARNLGLGSKLLNAFEIHISKPQINGIHLITSATSRNVTFYKRNGYIHAHTPNDCGGRVLLGKRLHAL